MRAIPTVIHNITFLTFYHNGTVKYPTVNSVSVNEDYELTFGITAVSGITTSVVALFWDKDKKLKFDAEIY